MRSRLEPAGLHEDQLRFPAPPLEEGGQGLLPGAVLGNLTGAEVDDALRTEHIRRQNIFNGSLIIQFDQGVHVPSAFLCFSPLYCVPAENTIDNPPGLSEKDVESRKNPAPPKRCWIRAKQGRGHSSVRSGRGTSGINSRLTTVRISSNLPQSSGEKRAMMRSMTSDI